MNRKKSPGRDPGPTWGLDSYMNEAGTIKYPLSLSKEQDAAIKEAAKKTGRSRADLIRDGVSRVMDELGIDWEDNLSPGGLRPGGFGRDDAAV